MKTVNLSFLLNRLLFLFIVCILITIDLKAISNDSLLLKTCTQETLREMLIKGTDWVSYPSYKDRDKWNSIVSKDIKESIIKSGEKALHYKWKPNLASQYFAYKNEGNILTNRDNYLAIQSLMLAELVEGEGRFMDALIDGVWFMCETSWQHASLLVFQKDTTGLPDPEEPTIELVVADVGAEMAWVYYFFHEEFDKRSHLISREIKKAVFKKMINPYFAREDYWWMGFSGRAVNNWNIWINYNVLQAVALLENDIEKRSEYIYQLIRSSEWFLRAYNNDGACDEGPTYWGHAGANLFKFLELLSQVTGDKINIFSDEKVRNIGKYIYRVNVDGNYFVNFSDAALKGNIKPGLVYQYGKTINDNIMMNFASEYDRKFPEKDFIGGCFATALDEILIIDEVRNNVSDVKTILSHYFKDSELVIARDNNDSSKGFCFAAHGSHNDLSHNHNDIGSCMLFYDGKPVLIDVGVGTYTKKTFSSERYTIWTMQSCYHNLPTINGYDQCYGKEFAASDVKFSDRKRNAKFSLDISGAYPSDAGIKSWIREYNLERNKRFIIKDKWNLDKIDGLSSFHFMTSCEVEIKDSYIILKGNNFKMKLSYNTKFKPIVDKVSFTDYRLLESWKNGYVYRISFPVNGMNLIDESVFIIENYN